MRIIIAALVAMINSAAMADDIEDARTGRWLKSIVAAFIEHRTRRSSDPNDLCRHIRLDRMLRRLELADMDSAAQVHRTALDQALPSLAGRHTPEEDRSFFCERVFKTCEIWGAFDGAAMIGMLAFREGWIDQLYVLPEAQGRGIGTELLQVAQNSFDRLHLWTFQRNRQARRFYEARGFALVRETDGSGNEEREPDALYLWTRP